MCLLSQAKFSLISQATLVQEPPKFKICGFRPIDATVYINKREIWIATIRRASTLSCRNSPDWGRDGYRKPKVQHLVKIAVLRHAGGKAVLRGQGPWLPTTWPQCPIRRDAYIKFLLAINVLWQRKTAGRLIGITIFFCV